MDIKQLQYFVVSVDMGSFCSAAEVLITTQPNVSKVVKSLETELNMILLNRDRSGVTLTKEGEHVYNYAIEILKNMRMITNFRNGFHIETLSISNVPSNIISNILTQFYNKTSNNKEFKIDFIESKVEFMEKSSGVAPRILIFNGFSCLFFLSFTDSPPAGTSSLAIVSIAIPAPFT